ncbi:hypothetical protein HGRIS_003773 [Hohenbuehelia grisea]|uniref:Calcium-transporting ATPase n=1 Tax=Hohenbuehelia grisea TaxID=104357 RepID=A0ABR3JGH2_9AGAR
MADRADASDVPVLNVTVADDDFSTSPASPSSPSSPTQQGFLSPKSPANLARTSLDVPASPTPTVTPSNDGSVPPSPTLSNRSSVHFNTSLALRENQPDATSGMNSLGLLETGDKSHNRKPSNATFVSSDGTEPDHHRSDSNHLTQFKSNTTSATHVNPAHGLSKPADSDAEKEKSKKKKSGKEKAAEEEEAERQRMLEQDMNFDPAPFKFKPFSLAHLLDPKSFETLASFGGTHGVLRGLGVNAKRGLGHQPLKRHATNPSQMLGAGNGASNRHDPEKGEVPGIMLTAPDSDEKRAIPGDDGDDDNDESSGAFRATLDDRRHVYGENVLPQRQTKTLLQLMWAAMKDKVLILLSVAAVVSLALGFFQDFGPPAKDSDEPPVDWVEGVAIVVAILIVVMVGSLNDWQKERQFQALNEKKDERGVKVIRDGVEHVIDIKEVVVGDIALLEPGEIIPCDGIFLSGHNVKCDESGATGESDAIKKISFEECEAIRQKALDDGEGDIHAKGGLDHALAHTDCFIISGSKVLEGVGKYVVVAVGQKSFNGRIMMALRGDTENTPLQVKLNNLAELIAKLGSLAGLLLFTALMIRFFVQLGTKNPPRTPNEHGIAFVNILIIAVTLVVVAVPEGLPLAVTLALAFATKRMTYEKLLVRVLGSCETMANASVVCTDKTGTLTQNDMTVVAGSIGIHCKFVRELEENKARTNADERVDEEAKATGPRRSPDDFSVDQAHLNNILSPQLQELVNAAIAVNSTAFEDEDPETKELQLVGSKTETALLKFSRELGWEHFKKVRDETDIVQMIPFSSERKAMGVVVRLGTNHWRLYLKGASEILTKKCTRHVVVRENNEHQANAGIETSDIGKAEEENISRTIIFYANQTLRTIAICYRDFESWPPRGANYESVNEVSPDDLFQDLTVIAITGIEDPLRPGVRDAVAKCQRAGVQVKMCTGDNVLTARSIALQCGIFTPGGIIMEGPDFRKLSRPEMLERVPRLQVLARSSPEDKKILVEALKSIGEIVGVTGDGTNDGPALKTAHVGFSMGIAGTEVAKEASDIILMDDNFASIVKAIMWGRCVNDSVRKFLQFQISVNVTAVIITFVTAVSSVEEESVLSAVQLLWINIIMDTFAALALATDPASEALLDRKPDKKTAPLFSVNMYKMIFLQSAYQTTMILIFHFLGRRILGFPHTGDENVDEHHDDIIQTLVFNAFVFAQIFNSINCRRLDRKLNVFEGINRNWYFMLITLLEVAIQVVIVFVGGAAFQVTRMGGREWGISLALGVVSLPLGALIRLLPNGPFEKLFSAAGLFGSKTPDVLPTSNPDSEWNAAITRVRDNLATFSNLRGGRVRSSSFINKSRSARLSNDQDRVPLPSLLTMAPSLMISTIGAGWAPRQSGSLSDPANSDPSKSSTALWEGRAQVHPDTDPNDPVMQKFSQYQAQTTQNQNPGAAP